MNFLKNIRQQYHLSQTGMAAMLNVSRSLLSLVEMGIRDLPASAIPKLKEMMDTHAAAQKISRQTAAKSTIDQATAEEANKLQQKLTIRLAKLQYQLIVLQKKLSTAETRHSNARVTLLHVQAHRSMRKGAPTTHLDQVWMNGTEANARLQLHSTPTYQLEMMRIKAELLAAEIGIIEGRIKGK